MSDFKAEVAALVEEEDDEDDDPIVEEGLAPSSLFTGGVYEYMYMEIFTKMAPMRNSSVGLKLKKKYDRMQEVTILNDAANPFRILSAYFTTTATTNPPMAWSRITTMTIILYP